MWHSEIYTYAACGTNRKTGLEGIGVVLEGVIKYRNSAMIEGLCFLNPVVPEFV